MRHISTIFQFLIVILFACAFATVTQNKPVSNYPIHANSESGYWVLVECRARLNTPGLSDGIQQLWIDGRLECERQNLNFRGNYTAHGINAVFIEAYWNQV